MLGVGYKILSSSFSQKFIFIPDLLRKPVYMYSLKWQINNFDIWQE